MMELEILNFDYNEYYEELAEVDRSKIDLVLNSFNCCVSHCPESVYVSVPLTTGRRYWEWYSKIGKAIEYNKSLFDSEFRKNVLDLNMIDADRHANLVRNERSSLVINPARLMMGEWSREKYLCLWAKVIEKHCYSVVFCPGWEYSVGCIYEFRVVKQLKKIAQFLQPEALTFETMKYESADKLVQQAQRNVKQFDF